MKLLFWTVSVCLAAMAPSCIMANSDLMGLEEEHLDLDFSTEVDMLKEDADRSLTRKRTGRFVGAVYAMSNLFDRNTVVAYGRDNEGQLALIKEFKTGGQGAFLDGGDGINPLVSANALHATQPIRYGRQSNRFLLAVNAGSNTVSSFLIQRDWSLKLLSVAEVPCTGPNTITSSNRLVYVGCNDLDGNTSPDQEGAVYGFYLKLGKLKPIRNSLRSLNNRASDVHFSPDGKFLLVSSFDAGAASLPDEDNEELVIYGVNRKTGRLSKSPIDSVASTAVNNAEGRNLASAIGFEVVRVNKVQYAVVSESREIGPDGTSPGFPGAQTGSVSVWRIGSRGKLIPVDLDNFVGKSMDDGQRTSCWLTFVPNKRTFFVSNTADSTIGSFRFRNGKATLLRAVAASGTPPDDPAVSPAGTDGFIDLQTTDDGKFLYQLHSFGETVTGYRIGRNGRLNLIETAVGNLPDGNTQGIVAI